jgi:hypothetical protein
MALKYGSGPFLYINLPMRKGYLPFERLLSKAIISIIMSTLANPWVA